MSLPLRISHGPPATASCTVRHRSEPSPCRSTRIAMRSPGWSARRNSACACSDDQHTPVQVGWARNCPRAPRARLPAPVCRRAAGAAARPARPSCLRRRLRRRPVEGGEQHQVALGFGNTVQPRKGLLRAVRARDVGVQRRVAHHDLPRRRPTNAWSARKRLAHQLAVHNAQPQRVAPVEKVGVDRSDRAVSPRHAAGEFPPAQRALCGNHIVAQRRTETDRPRRRDPHALNRQRRVDRNLLEQHKVRANALLDLFSGRLLHSGRERPEQPPQHDPQTRPAGAHRPELYPARAG
jgi:hypothetical protein